MGRSRCLVISSRGLYAPVGHRRGFDRNVGCLDGGGQGRRRRAIVRQEPNCSNSGGTRRRAARRDIVHDEMCRNGGRAGGSLQTGTEVDVIKPAPVRNQQAGVIVWIGNAAVEAVMDVLRDGRFSAALRDLSRLAARTRRNLCIRPGRRTLNKVVIPPRDTCRIERLSIPYNSYH
jgi:hypothetical protein